MKSSLRWLVILFGVLAVAWFSYRLGQGDLFVQGKEGWELGLTFADDSPGWSVHQDPSGFAIEVPDGWGARADGASGRAVVIGPLGEQVVIWPVFAAGARGLPAPVVLQQLAAEVFPKASWGAPRASGPGSAAQYGRDGERSLAAGFAAVVSPRGVAGTFYCVAAPPESFGRDNETFTRILQSFKAAGPEAGGQGQAPPARRYVRWSDPSENAFSVEVPADWRTEGGLLRLAPVDTRTAFSVTSPDGAVRIVAGDSRIPNFGVPNQTLAFTGFNEGSWYSPGYGVNMMIRRFVPGTAFAAEYVQSQVAQACGGLRIDGSRDRPDAVAAIDRISQQYGAYGVSVRTTAGEVKFGCSGQSGPLRGYYYATTQLTEAYGMGLWNVPHLYGYLAAQDREGEAQEVLSHMIQTVRINPQWEAMQQGITANTSQIVADTNQAITQMINQSFQNTQSTYDELSRRRSNATRGVVDVIDQTSGQPFQVESGSNYYWIDHRGNIVGTDVYTQPTIDFQEMLQLP